jgi:ATP-dependent Clp protease ATP-binding subunit ClpC
VDFRNTVIILTSNLGTAEKVGTLGFQRAKSDGEREQRHRNVEEALRQAFRPEFLNRLDEIIVFEALTEAEIAKVADLMLAEVRERLAERGVDFEVTEAAKAALVSEGYDPTYGARPLRRTIQRRVENELARRVLSGEFSEGDRVLVDVGEGGEFLFTGQPAREGVAV